MKHRKRSALGLILSAAIGLGMVGGAAANSWMTGAVDGDDVRFSGCVIRFSDPDGKPSIYANGSHVAAGCKSVSIAPNGRMVVQQTVRGAADNPVIFAFAQADETLAARGITIGASGGTDDTEFVFYDSNLGRQLDLTKKSDRMRLQGKNANAWLGWTHTTWGATR